MPIYSWEIQDKWTYMLLPAAIALFLLCEFVEPINSTIEKLIHGYRQQLPMHHPFPWSPFFFLIKGKAWAVQSETSKVKAVRGVGLTEDSWFREFSAPASATYFPQAFLIFIYLFLVVVGWCHFNTCLLRIRRCFDRLMNIFSRHSTVLSSSPLYKDRNRGLEQEYKERYGDKSWIFGISVLALSLFLILWV